MAKWVWVAAAAPVLCVACLLPSLGGLEGASIVAADAAAEAAPDAGKIDAPVAADGADVGTTDFFDDFNRADGPAIGNGWIMKKPSCFALKGGTVRWLGGDPLSYRDHVVYRPAVEDRRDVKAQMTVAFAANAPSPNYPQIHVRIQAATVAVPDSLDSYLLYVDDTPGSALISRQRGTPFTTTVGTVTISPQLVQTKIYRFTLIAVGANPVNLTGTIEVQENNQWTVIGTKSVVDADPARIDTAGAVGFSGGDGVAGVHTYDDFSATAP